MTEQSTPEERPDEERRRVRTRTRSRAAGADGKEGTGSGRSSSADAESAAAPEQGPGEASSGEASPGEAAPSEPAAGGGQPEGEAASSEPAAGGGQAESEDSGHAGAGGGQTAEGTVRVRRRRGGRGRRGSGSGGQQASGAQKGAARGSGGSGKEAESRDDAGKPAAKGKGGERQPAKGKKQGSGQGRQDDGRQSSARAGGSRRGGGGQRRSRGRDGRGGGQRPSGGVSEETRRTITEGPPRRMLVNVGDVRTQIAVLEERDLVEHYVTRKEEVSYVGNVYLGRVQNVLPGMEAAFIDIGKGRNGVLYAGEVNYDEADLDEGVPRIEQTLKSGQTVLVQVTKDPMGTKGARLTQNLSIAGRYCVLAPGDGMLGISRKLTDEERSRLRGILKEIRPEGFGLIVRTAAEGATAEQLKSDVERLAAKWEQVQRRAEKAKPLEAVYEEPDLVIRVIRDIFGPEYTELIVDSEELGRQVKDYLADVSPEHVDKVSVYQGEDSIFDAYEVTTQIRRALEKKVWLKSGGYLIVEKTEAMWVIDVNTGRFVGKSNLEETVLRNNLEAADEIARQLRLRDMGGIIVIDFVDMLVPANREEVLKRFRRELARDKTKSRVMEISKLGLVEMTRKNVSQGLTESFTTTCDCCEGRGAQIIDLG